MGNDGGSIPDRRDLVKNKPKAEQADKNNQTIAVWFFCALSKRPLQEPVVSCALGKMYNKDAILEYLLDKSAYGDGANICGHIKSLKDVKTLRLTLNPTSDPSSDEAFRHAQFICPLTLKEMSGSLPFVYLTTCGCVFSTAGLKAVSSPSPSSSSSGATPPLADGTTVDSPDVSSNTTEPCPQCAKPFSRSADVRTINPGPEEQEQMREKMIIAAAEAKLAKQASKKRKAATNTVDVSDLSSDAPAKRSKTTTDPSIAPVLQPMMNPSISSVARKVTEELAEEEKKRKANMSSAVRSLYGPKDGKKKKETFMTMGTFTRYA
ncbi:hypothetical protein FRB95_013766 [Tulasnella sp. JGI-2019a]|nr:hypothetical protein FRB95_013766 [Tulasnella sp. JGI-2019a]